MKFLFGFALFAVLTISINGEDVQARLFPERAQHGVRAVPYQEARAYEARASLHDAAIPSDRSLRKIREFLSETVGTIGRWSRALEGELDRAARAEALGAPAYAPRAADIAPAVHAAHAAHAVPHY